MDELRAFGVPLEGLHTETGPGVFEAAIVYSDALEAADRAVLFKTAVKEIGQRFGIMPRSWRSGTPSCRAAAATSTRASGTRSRSEQRRSTTPRDPRAR